MSYIITAIVSGCLGFCAAALCSVPKSKYKQQLDDEAQMEFLKVYKERNSKDENEY